jgi:hypothetical protein
LLDFSTTAPIPLTQDAQLLPHTNATTEAAELNQPTARSCQLAVILTTHTDAQMALALPPREAALCNQQPVNPAFNSAPTVSAGNLETAQLMTVAHSTNHFNAVMATVPQLLLNVLATLTALPPLHSDVPTTSVSRT